MQNQTPQFACRYSFISGCNRAWEMLRKAPYRARAAGFVAGVFWMLLLCLSRGSAVEVILLQGKQTYAYEEDAIRKVATFYGVEVRTVDSSSQQEVVRALAELSKAGTVAVLGSPQAISQIDRRLLSKVLVRPKGKSIPILMFGVQPGANADELKSWSGSAIRGCTAIEVELRSTLLHVERTGDLASTLADIRLPGVTFPACRLELGASKAVEPVLSMSQAAGMDLAVLVRIRTKAQDLFVIPQLKLYEKSWIGRPDGLPSAFSSLAPFILFLSAAAGEYGWHSDGHYANLTIDDAWLTQPFGHLDYFALLGEMQKHNFHTTIAFIPWNFDRSKSDVIRLFREHPEHFSVCMHGNDHSHREFGDYGRNPLHQQVAAIRQGIARMERFQGLTGIPYDRFMVFPHAVAPEQTFAALKTYGFSGTANSSNVPTGRSFPKDPTFLLRPYTAAYEGLLSLNRYPASGNTPRLEIVIQSFLGNPLLFYGHESLFKKGAGAFDRFADDVNQVEPKTEWKSLGYIARHSYLLRRRADGGFDVQMFSTEIDLRNPLGSDVDFYIHRERHDLSESDSLSIDGVPAKFDQSESLPLLRLSIPPHAIRKIRVAYRNDLNTSREGIAKSNLYAYALRTVSDFRDLKLSRSSWGDRLISAYYRRNWDSIELYLEDRWYALIALGIAFLVFWDQRRRRALRSDSDKTRCVNSEFAPKSTPSELETRIPSPHARQ